MTALELAARRFNFWAMTHMLMNWTLKLGDTSCPEVKPFGRTLFAQLTTEQKLLEGESLVFPQV